MEARLNSNRAGRSRQPRRVVLRPSGDGDTFIDATVAEGYRAGITRESMSIAMHMDSVAHVLVQRAARMPRSSRRTQRHEWAQVKTLVDQRNKCQIREDRIRLAKSKDSQGLDQVNRASTRPHLGRQADIN